VTTTAAKNKGDARPWARPTYPLRARCQAKAPCTRTASAYP
jgi:hypothetical protein